MRARAVDDPRAAEILLRWLQRPKTQIELAGVDLNALSNEELDRLQASLLKLAAMPDQIRKLLAKGASGGLFFVTDDAQRSYEELKGRGVEFTQEPTEQPYGIDAGFRDVSGNHFRMAQSPS